MLFPGAPIPPKKPQSNKTSPSNSASISPWISSILYFGDIQATLVKLKADSPEYLAIALQLTDRGQSELWVYDNAKQLVYRETIPGLFNALAAIPYPSGAESLLVGGGEGKVWQYKATGKHP